MGWMGWDGWNEWRLDGEWVKNGWKNCCGMIVDGVEEWMEWMETGLGWETGWRLDGDWMETG